MEKEPILTFEHVTGKKNKFNLNDISFRLYPGFIYGLMGKNGAGKTTLMKYVLEENLKYSGAISVCGENIRENHRKTINRIGYVSEDYHFFEQRTGKQNAQIFGMLYESFVMDKFMEMMDKMEVSSNRTYKKMSRGERLKFQLAFAIAHNPCLYLLDEVTAGMDPVFRLEFFDIIRNLIKDENCSVLITSHIESEIEMKTDYVAIMENGSMCDFIESPDIASYGRTESRICI